MDEFHKDQLIAQMAEMNIFVVDSGIEDLGHFVAIDVNLPSPEEEDLTIYPTADTTAELVSALLKANRLAAEKNAKMEGLREDAIAKCDRVFGLSDEEIEVVQSALRAWNQEAESTGFAVDLIARLEASKGR